MALYGGNNSLGGNNNNSIPAQNQRCSNGLLILDSSDVANRVPDPQLKYIKFLSWCDQQVDPDFGDGSTASAHAVEYVRHENGKEYIVTTDESGGGLNGDPAGVCAQRTYGRMIDISDEQNPKVVGTFKPDVNKPENCAANLAADTDGGMIHYLGFDDRNHMRLTVYAGANYGIRVVDWRDPTQPKEIAYYKKGRHTTTAQGETDFTRPDPRYDAANCFFYTGWNQGGLVSIELTNPEYNSCMRKTTSGFGVVANPGGGPSKTKFTFSARRAQAGLGNLEGSLTLVNPDAGADIRITQLTFLGSVRDACGSVPTGARSLQFEGSGTYNGTPASFRVCTQEGATAAPSAHRFNVACTAGCNFSTGGALATGNIAVRPQ
jgi:hypothetical protein